MKITFKDNMWIDGETYLAGRVYKFPDWLAKVYITEGIAEVPKPQGTFTKPEKKETKLRS